MSFEVEALTPFLRALKRLSKKYRSLKDDVAVLGDVLAIDPFHGVALGNNCFKIRLAVSSKGKGKSGGARVITCVKVSGRKVFLLDIYDKSESDSLSPKHLERLVALVPSG